MMRPGWSRCPAKVTAAKVPLGNTRRNINAAIAISRVYPALVQEIKKMQPEEFMQLSRMGSTGISWAANSGESTGSGQRRYIAADGIENVIKILEAIEDEQFTRLDFVELSACPGGCVGGVMNVENPFAAAARIKRLARDLPAVGTRWPTPDCLPEEVYFDKRIEPMNVMSLDSDPVRSLELFAKMQSYERKFPGLDCGSCGSPTCHALAEDIVRGYRTEDDCIYLLKEKLEKLAAICDKHHGPAQITIGMKRANGDCIYFRPQGLAVRPAPKFIEVTDSLFGAGAASLRGNRNRPQPRQRGEWRQAAE